MGDGHGRQVFLYKDGATTNLTNYDYELGEAYGAFSVKINNNGQIVWGEISPSGMYNASTINLWVAGTTTTFGSIETNNLRSVSLNDLGQVIWVSTNNDGYGPNLYLLNKLNPSTIPQLIIGENYCYYIAINNLGQIVYKGGGGTISLATPQVEVATKVYTICIGARTINKWGSDARGDYAATVMYNKFKNLYNATEPLIWGELTTGGINKSDIEKTISDTKLIMKPNDLLIIYITGHGGYVTSNGGAYVLLGNYSLDVSPNEDQMLKDSDLYKYLQDMDDKSKWVIIDACHSGGFWTSLKQLKKIGFLAACQGGDNLYSFTGMTINILSPNYGIFTSFALEDAFSKNSNGRLKADTDGQAGLSFEEFASYASLWGRVSSLAGVVVREMAFGDEVIFGPETWNPTAAKTDNVAGVKSTSTIAPIISLLLMD